jgi:hypothetical protein
MRKVSQAWLDNQLKTIRDKGLLRIDFFSPQINNNNAVITANDVDVALSNLDNIKSIYPYDLNENQGYVSDFLSEADGSVSAIDPQVSIESQAGNIGITITFSDEAYAIDYDVTMDGSVYSYTGNTEKTVFVPIIATGDDTYHINVKKWSLGASKIKIERVYTGLHLIYREPKIYAFNERKISSVLSLELPQNQISFTLDNIDRKFDVLYQNSYLQYLSKSTEIRTYYGFNLTTGEEWIKGGTYYLTDWRAPSNSLEATFEAKDILNKINGYPNLEVSKYSPNGVELDKAMGYAIYDDFFINYKDKTQFRKNKLIPDLSTSTLIDDSSGEYRVYDANGFTIDYNINSGVYTINGTPLFDLDEYPISFELELTTGDEITISSYFISQAGTVTDLDLFMPADILNVNIVDSDTQSLSVNSDFDEIGFRFRTTQTFNDFKFRLQAEFGLEKTDYHIPIHNDYIDPLKEKINRKEYAQLVAQAVNCYLWIDPDGQVYLVKNRYFENENAEVANNIMFKKPEFVIEEQVKDVEVIRNNYSNQGYLSEVYREDVDIDIFDSDVIEIELSEPSIFGAARFENVDGVLSVETGSEVDDNYIFYSLVPTGDGTGTLIIERYLVNNTKTVFRNNLNTDGITMSLDNKLVTSNSQVNNILQKVVSELISNINVYLETRMDPAFDVGDLIAFPFVVDGLYVIGFLRLDEIEINYNGSYRGKLVGRYLLYENLILGAKTYVLKSGETYADEETLLWHLQNA